MERDSTLLREENATEKKQGEVKRVRVREASEREGMWRPREEPVCAQIDSDEDAKYQSTGQ